MSKIKRQQYMKKLAEKALAHRASLKAGDGRSPDDGLSILPSLRLKDITCSVCGDLYEAKDGIIICRKGHIRHA